LAELSGGMAESFCQVAELFYQVAESFCQTAELLCQLADLLRQLAEWFYQMAELLRQVAESFYQTAERLRELAELLCQAAEPLRQAVGQPGHPVRSDGGRNPPVVVRPGRAVCPGKCRARKLTAGCSELAAPGPPAGRFWNKV